MARESGRTQTEISQEKAIRMTTERNICELLTVKEVAGLLKIHVRSVWRMAATGQIPEPIRLGPKTVRWRAVDLEAHLTRLAGPK